jgi:hypothetical protein
MAPAESVGTGTRSIKAQAKAALVIDKSSLSHDRGASQTLIRKKNRTAAVRIDVYSGPVKD